MHVHGPIFHGQHPNLNSLDAREGGKKCLKTVKKSVTHVSTCIFHELFKNTVFNIGLF